MTINFFESAIYSSKKLVFRLQTNNDYEPSSLSQRGDILADSLRETTRTLFYLFIGIMIYVAFGVPEAYADNPDIDFFRFWIPFTIIIFSVTLICNHRKARLA